MNKLRFLHIPKTAGSSFGECLFIQYYRDYLLRRVFTMTGNIALDARRYRELNPSRRSNIALYVGHGPRISGFKDIDSLATITLLRDPIQRVISLCQHVSEGKSPRWTQHYTGHKSPDGISPDGALDLEAFIARGGARVSNQQSRILLGDQSYQLPPGDNESLAQQAFEILRDDIDAFGVTEDFDTSLLLLQKTLGWKNPPIYRVRNTGNQQARIPLEDQHIEHIRELNLIDSRLYDLARELFQQRVAALCPDIEQDLVRFKAELERSSVMFRLIDTGRSLASLSRGLKKTDT